MLMMCGWICRQVLERQRRRHNTWPPCKKRQQSKLEKSILREAIFGHDGPDKMGMSMADKMSTSALDGVNIELADRVSLRPLDRVRLINDLYEHIDEDKRLERSRQGQLEFFITMNYINRFLHKGDRVLEIGAGTGRYSRALAQEGFHVFALELVKHNLSVLKEHAKDLVNLEACQGDALDLSRYADNMFDVTLLFGPLYHLYDRTDQHKALDEAIRVTKTGGIILVSFLSAHAIICTNYLYDAMPTVQGLNLNFDAHYNVRHFKEQLFTGFDVCEFEGLFTEKETKHITTIAVDGVLEIAERRADFSMTDEDFKAFADYHLQLCEKREMLGYSSHLLYICQKN